MRQGPTFAAMDHLHPRRSRPVRSTANSLDLDLDLDARPRRSTLDARPRPRHSTSTLDIGFTVVDDLRSSNGPIHAAFFDSLRHHAPDRGQRLRGVRITARPKAWGRDRIRRHRRSAPGDQARAARGPRSRHRVRRARPEQDLRGSAPGVSTRGAGSRIPRSMPIERLSDPALRLRVDVHRERRRVTQALLQRRGGRTRVRPREGRLHAGRGQRGISGRVHGEGAPPADVRLPVALLR